MFYKIMFFFMKLFGGGSSGESPESESPSTPPTGLAKPIRLVYTDENGKFQMDPEAVALLQLVKEPIGIVSVCGRARQGKSFLLNQLLGQSTGFQVASTHRPCTKGLWLWSEPLKRTALDGTEYNLFLLDSEGIDAYDQTGAYSVQIFSLAVLLSSTFIYNQMGGIDEVALDRLPLVTEMAKNIHVQSSEGEHITSELGQFSPIFVWLLRDFYLNLVEDNHRITPHDYLELALGPVKGSGKDVDAKNEVRESTRALFPDRECFTLVRPLNDENDLQQLDQISLERLRPEFRAGLDSLTRFVFERTRPKQVGSTVMTGPILVRITQSFLDAINNGAVPNISSSWKSVEEAECQKAYELGTEIYMSSIDRSKPPEEALLREAHEDAYQKSIASFNAAALGTGPTRQKFEKRLQSFLEKAFEDFKKDAFREASLKCTNAIENMGKELRMTCDSFDANISTVLKVIDGLLSDYEATCHGPDKWPKAFQYLQQSLQGPIADFMKKQMNDNFLALKCRSIEDKANSLKKQLEASEKHKSEYLKRYEDSIKEKKMLANDYTNRMANLQRKCNSLEDKSSSLSEARQESMYWKGKYETAQSMLMRAEQETALLKSSAAHEKARSAREEAEEWKRKYEIAVRETKMAVEKAEAAQSMLRAEKEIVRSKSSAAHGKAQKEAEEWKRKYEIAAREAKMALEKAAAASVKERTNNRTRSIEGALGEDFSNFLCQLGIN